MKHFHPRKGDHGQQIELHAPSQPTALSSWDDPNEIATVTPDGMSIDLERHRLCRLGRRTDHCRRLGGAGSADGLNVHRTADDNRNWKGACVGYRPF